jgi:hypothetical protein
MKKIIKHFLVLGFIVGLFILFGGGETIRNAWAQARTVLYKDFAQTVTVPHVFSPSSVGPPFTVAGNGAGVAATGLAPDRLDSVVWNALPAPAVFGRMRVLENGGAIGSTIVDDGTEWNCNSRKELKVVVVTCPPFNAKGDGTTNDSAAFTAAIGTGNTTLLIPAGTFLIQNVYFKSNLTIRGMGVGVTVLKLPNSTIASVLVNPEAGPVNNVEVSHLTIDGNAANQTTPNVAAFGGNGITNFWFHHLEVKNSIEYCIGLEHGTHKGKISDTVIGPCRWDGIDIKNANNDTEVEITNVSVFGPGTTFGSSAGVVGGTCIDSGGRNRMTNVRCTGLTGQTYGFGFRRHETGPSSNCNLGFCNGGEGSSLSNFFVEGDAVTTTNAVGVRVRDAFVQVSNGLIVKVGRGVWIESDVGLGEARDVVVSNVIVYLSELSAFRTDAAGPFASFLNCIAIGISGGYGAYLGAGGERFIGGSISSAFLDGILVGTGAHNAKIIGNNISTNGLSGVSVAAGVINTVILGNTIAGNGLAPISDAGTTTRILDNPGVVTQADGLATVVSGTTSIVVTHGLDFTPANSEIKVTLLENPTNDIGLVWVDTVTATQFTIRTRSDPGASNLDVGWKVAIKE